VLPLRASDKPATHTDAIRWRQAPIEWAASYSRQSASASGLDPLGSRGILAPARTSPGLASGCKCPA